MMSEQVRRDLWLSNKKRESVCRRFLRGGCVQALVEGYDKPVLFNASSVPGGKPEDDWDDYNLILANVIVPDENILVHMDGTLSPAGRRYFDDLAKKRKLTEANVKKL